jgi:hypothetical protein
MLSNMIRQKNLLKMLSKNQAFLRLTRCNPQRGLAASFLLAADVITYISCGLQMDIVNHESVRCVDLNFLLNCHLCSLGNYA